MKEDAQTVSTKHLDQFRAMLEESEIDFDEGATAGDDFGDFIQVRNLMFLFDDQGSLVELDDVGE